MVAFQFFSRRVAGVAYVYIPCVVAVAEYSIEFEGSTPRSDGFVYFTRCLVYDFADAFYFILVIIHFDDENFGLWWDFFVRDFSRCAVYTFKRALVDLFIGLLVGVFPVLIFLPCLVVESCAGEDGGGSAPQRRVTVLGLVPRLFH